MTVFRSRFRETNHWQHKDVTLQYRKIQNTAKTGNASTELISATMGSKTKAGSEIVPNDKKIQLFFLEAIAAKLILLKGNRTGSRCKVPKNTSFLRMVSSFAMLDACSSL